MEDKHIRVKEYLLNLLESGQIKAGDRLPGARRLTKEAGASYTHIQTVLECLVQSGIFEAVTRSGTFVQQNWAECLLPATFYCYHQNQPCFCDLELFFRKKLPQIHVCKNCDVAGKRLSEIHLRADYGVSVIAIRRDGDAVVSPDGNTVLEEGDTAVVIGERAAITEILPLFTENTTEKEE